MKRFFFLKTLILIFFATVINAQDKFQCVDSNIIINDNNHIVKILHSWDERVGGKDYVKINCKYYSGVPELTNWKENYTYFNPLDFVHKMFNQNDQYRKDKLAPKVYCVPTSFRYYLKPNEITAVDSLKSLMVSMNYDSLSFMYQPFFMKKTEVTNKEYRAFYNYVKDSIAHNLIGGDHLKNGIIDWSKEINWYNEKLDSFRLPRIEWFALDSVHTNKVIFKKSNLKNDTICISPNKMCWINDFNSSYYNFLTRQYFNLNAYDNYPVVGVSWNQAMAFCKWKEKEINKLNKDTNIYYIVTLPNTVQWEWAGFYDRYMSFEPWGSFSDRSFISDLGFTNYDYRSKTLDGELIDRWPYFQDWNYITYERRNNNEFIYNKFADGSWFTYHVRNIKKKKWHKTVRVYKRVKILENNGVHILNDNKGLVYGMGTNVSEWMLNDYSQWEIIFNKRQEFLKIQDNKSAILQSQIEEYWNDRTDKDGKLVMGANWVDQRYDYKFDKNVNGMNAKSFVSPNKSYSTLGFRYVVIPVIKN